MKTGSIRFSEFSFVLSASFLISVATLIVLVGSGCTHVAQTRGKAGAQLDEHSRALTTAVVDTLHLQPTDRRDEFSDMALRLAQEDQRIEGMPVASMAVAELVGLTDTNLSLAEASLRQSLAKENLGKRFAEIRELLGTERRAQERLVAFGQRFEQERNEKRAGLFKRWSTAALVVGGLVALAVFFPAAIPLLGRILAWCVGRVPALAGATGVVSVKAFDAVVKAIERSKSTATPPGQFQNQVATSYLEDLPFHLSREMDAAHKELVRQRKAALELDR